MEGKKIVVPEFVKSAIRDSARYLCAWNENLSLAQVDAVGETVCRAISENPIVPTEEQASDMLGTIGPGTVDRCLALVAAEWQRRMFLAPEPKFPEEIKDLLFDLDSEKTTGERQEHNRDVLEAYRRGQRSK